MSLNAFSSQFIPVSAKTGEGLADLEAAIALLAEEMPHLSLPPPPSPSSPITTARGFVLESKVDKHRGRLLQVIVRSGFLREGAWVAVGPRFGRIKRMYLGAEGPQAGLQQVKVAGMNQAVEIGGLGDMQVSAGQLLVQARTQQQAARLAAMAERATQVRMMRPCLWGSWCPTDGGNCDSFLLLRSIETFRLIDCWGGGGGGGAYKSLG